ncbi:hypothetical protein T09_2235, partial [Trichinella sp. T9]
MNKDHRRYVTANFSNQQQQHARNTQRTTFTVASSFFHFVVWTNTVVSSVRVCYWLKISLSASEIEIAPIVTQFDPQVQSINVSKRFTLDDALMCIIA